MKYGRIVSEAMCDMNLAAFKNQLNHWGEQRTPFFFCIDFELEKPFALTLDEMDNRNILFTINGFTNVQAPLSGDTIGVKDFIKTPIPFSDYETKFNRVRSHLAQGDSFLTNLTIQTKIETPHTLEEIFQVSSAKYKLLVKDEFLVFSPETFVQIRDGKIHTYPMKGTMDASVPNAEQIMLTNQKEMAEHITIVDLLRNDLSMVAENVRVARFRYIDQINTSNKKLLQVSSEITGSLSPDWHVRLGDILLALLPAGSVSGAPKPKTTEIIAAVEGGKRGYYTGVMGYFDGTQLDSAVMIRYIEQKDHQLYYRSGGGITTQSDAGTEYQEAIDKVYVPVN